GARVISFLWGATLGRWNAAALLTPSEQSLVIDAFAPSPVHQDVDPNARPFVVDDLGHQDDGVHRIIDALRNAGGTHPEETLAGIGRCLLGGDADLRSFLRSGFFDDHIKRYSKSRRKAPIYWQLATPSASYSVWLYYHRFTRDTLYRVLNDYVAPKV